MSQKSPQSHRSAVLMGSPMLYGSVDPQTEVDLFSDSTLDEVDLLDEKDYEIVRLASGKDAVAVDREYLSTILSNYRKLSAQNVQYARRIEALREKELDLASQSVDHKRGDLAFNEYLLLQHQNGVLMDQVLVLQSLKETVLLNHSLQAELDRLKEVHQEELNLARRENQQAIENAALTAYAVAKVEENAAKSINSLQQQLQQVLEDKEVLAARIKESDSIQLRMKAELKQAQEQSASLLQRIRESEVERARHEEAFVTLQTEHACSVLQAQGTLAELSKLRHQWQDVSQRNQNTEYRMQELTQQLAVSEKQVREAESRCAQLESHVSTLSQLKGKLESAVEKLDAKVADLTKENTILEGKLKDLAASEEGNAADQQPVSRGFTLSTKSHDAPTPRTLGLSARLTSPRTVIRDPSTGAISSPRAAPTLTDLENRVRQLDTEKQSLQAELESVRLLHQELEADCKSKQHLISSLQVQIIDLTGQNQAEKRTNEELQGEIRHLKLEKDGLLQQKAQNEGNLIALLDTFETHPDGQMQIPASSGHTLDYIYQKISSLYKTHQQLRKSEVDYRVEISLLKERLKRSDLEIQAEANALAYVGYERPEQRPSAAGDSRASGLHMPLPDESAGLRTTFDGNAPGPYSSSNFGPAQQRYHSMSLPEADADVQMLRPYGSFTMGAKADAFGDDEDSAKLRRFTSGIGAEDRIARLNMELNYLASTLDQRTKEMKHLFQQLRQAKKDLAESEISKRDLDINRTELRESLSSLNARLVSLQKTHDELSLLVSRKSDQLSESEAEISRLRESLIAKSRECQSINYKVQDLEAKCEVLEDTKREYHQKVIAMKQQSIQDREKLQAEIEHSLELEQMIEDEKKEQSKMLMEKTVLMIKIESLTTNLKEERDRNEKLGRTIRSLQEEIDGYKTMKREPAQADLSRAARDISLDLTRLAEQSRQDYSAEIEQLRRTLSQTQANLERTKVLLESEKELTKSFKTKCDTAEQQIQELREENNRLDDANSELSALNTRQKREIQDITAVLHQTKLDLQLVREEKASLGIAYESLKAQSLVLQSTIEQLQRDTEEHRRNYEQAKLHSSKLQDDLATLKRSLDHAESGLKKESEAKRFAQQDAVEKAALAEKADLEKTEIKARLAKSQEVLSAAKLELLNANAQIDQLRHEAEFAKQQQEQALNLVKAELADSKAKLGAQAENLRSLQEKEMRFFNILSAEYETYLRLPTSQTAYGSFTASEQSLVSEGDHTGASRDVDVMLTQLKNIWSKQIGNLSSERENILRLLVTVIHDIQTVFSFAETTDLVLNASSCISGTWRQVSESLGLVVPKTAQGVMRYLLDEIRGLSQTRDLILDERIRLKNELHAQASEKESIQRSLNAALDEIEQHLAVIRQYSAASSTWVQERSSLHNEKSELQGRIAQLLGDVESYRTMELRYAQLRETWSEERAFLIEERDRAIAFSKSPASGRAMTLSETQMSDKIKMLESQCELLQQELVELEKKQAILASSNILGQKGYGSVRSMGEESPMDQAAKLREAKRNTVFGTNSALYRTSSLASNDVNVSGDLEHFVEQMQTSSNPKLAQLIADKERWEGIVLRIASLLDVAPPSRIDAQGIEDFGQRILARVEELSINLQAARTSFVGDARTVFAKPVSKYTSSHQPTQLGRYGFGELSPMRGAENSVEDFGRSSQNPQGANASRFL
eukprot:TRINITY_DN3781_c0_g1_i1.p1 TRINITY_DN3781_c0_g1~~TRINITY_DN3781_c0_g1_i1.p1  ORF type:complete len:1702 (+),score=447.01 TRINITY_DN3781_c0_g1_i1:75-5180(+)